MTILFTEPSFVPVSGNSVVYPGAKLYFYETGTSNLQNTYSEYTLTTAHANPVVADADGRFAPIYLDPSLEDYKVVLKDSSDVTIWTVDPYSAINNTTRLGTMSDLLSASTALGTVSINGYHTAGDGGSSVFYWDASQDKANHNGGTIIDPDVTFPSDWTNQTQVTTWFTAGTGTGCWVRVSNRVTARAFGAKGNGTDDDTTPVEKYLTFAADTEYGGLADFDGCETMRLTREITIPNRGLRIRGDGRAGIYANLHTRYFGSNKLATFLVDHNDRNCFKIVHPGGGGRGLLVEDINVTIAPGSTCTAAFGFDQSEDIVSGTDYAYDMMFRRVGVWGFVCAFDAYIATTSITYSMAGITIDNCAINGNDWIARTLDGSQWNGFTFTNNLAGQQSVGGIDVSAHKFVEFNNLLEGMPNPIKISGAYRGFNSFGSYFEINTGRALIELSAVRGPIKIGPHAILDQDGVDTKIYANSCGALESSIPFVGSVYKSKMPWFGDSVGSENDLPNIDTATYEVSSINPPSAEMLERPAGIITSASAAASAIRMVRERSPFNGKAIPLELFTAASTGAISQILTLAGNSGEYLNITYLVKHINDGLGNPAPYLAININGASASGSRDYSFSGAGLWFRDGDWMVIQAVVKLGAAMTSVTSTLFPFGINPTAGRLAHMLPANAYTVADLRDCRPYIDTVHLEYLAAAPTAGTWEVGDSFLDITPSAGGTMGWVCTTAGTPGTWKTFGAITA